jgi:hypothetical protein
MRIRVSKYVRHWKGFTYESAHRSSFQSECLAIELIRLIKSATRYQNIDVSKSLNQILGLMNTVRGSHPEEL